MILQRKRSQSSFDVVLYRREGNRLWIYTKQSTMNEMQAEALRF
jgi:hypothetical protein